jgi:hypothetical protein
VITDETRTDLRTRSASPLRNKWQLTRTFTLTTAEANAISASGEAELTLPRTRYEDLDHART